MSVSKWRWTEACNGIPCPGDCDLCDFDPEDTDPEYDYTVTTNTDRIQAQPMKWQELISKATDLQIAWETIPEEYFNEFEKRLNEVK